MNIDFVNRLKPLIEEARARGVTDVDMEVAMTLPVHSINRWFRGVNKSYDRYADRLADYFGVSKHYLYGIDAENTPPEGNGLSPALQELFDYLKDKPDEQVQQSIRVIKAMFGE